MHSSRHIQLPGRVRPKNPAAVAWGQLGGKARAAKLPKAKLVDIAKQAAAVRWNSVFPGASRGRRPGRAWRTDIDHRIVIAALHQFKNNMQEAAQLAKIPLTTFRRYVFEKHKLAAPKRAAFRLRISAGRDLNPVHQKYLTSAGLSSDVIHARGARRYLSTHYGLSIRLHPVLGNEWTLHRQDNGTYAPPLRTASAIVDVSPVGWELVSDASRPLFVADGPIEADAAVSRGIACVSVRANRLCLRRWPWEEIGVSSRDIYLAFSPGPGTARKAEDALADFLTEKGARVRVLSLPTDFCVFLCDGRGEADLLGLARDRI